MPTVPIPPNPTQLSNHTRPPRRAKHPKTLNRRRRIGPRRLFPRYVRGVTVALASLLACGLFSGCSSTRPLGAAALGAGGAALGHTLTHGNVAATAAGAAGGVLLSEGLHALASKETRKAYQSGYEQGRSDAVKQQYWLQVQAQRRPETGVRLYPVELPEQRIDGVLYQSTVKYLRIEE